MAINPWFTSIALPQGGAAIASGQVAVGSTAAAVAFVATPNAPLGQNTLASELDPNYAGGHVNGITAVYTTSGNEVANDIIYICKVPAGVLVDPTGSTVASNGYSTTGTMTIGDTDTQGGTVTPDGSRYSGSIDAHAASTTPIVFASGTTLTAPAEITDEGVWLTATLPILTVPVANKTIVFRFKFIGLD